MPDAANTTPPRSNRTRLILWVLIFALLAAPAVAMMFTSEVNWDAADFGFAAALLIGGGVLYELIALKARRPATRALIGLAILAIIALIWIEAAVGIFH